LKEWVFSFIMGCLILKILGKDAYGRLFLWFMKWILLSPNRYKLVDDDDLRLEVKLPSKVKTGTPTVRFIPNWKKYETPMMIGDGHAQLDASDKFTAEKEHQLKTDPSAARWEKSRKEWFQKQKHNWRQKEMTKLREKGL